MKYVRHKTLDTYSQVFCEDELLFRDMGEGNLLLNRLTRKVEEVEDEMFKVANQIVCTPALILQVTDQDLPHFIRSA